MKRFEESGPLPYQFEPRRVRQNVEEDSVDSDTNPL